MLVVALGVGGIAVWSVPGMSKPIKGFFFGPTGGVIPYTVHAGSLEIAIDARGALESSKNVDVYCNVEGGTTIIKIVSEGARVKKGELLAELDSASLKDQLINQRITTKSAEANYLNAKLTREVAEISVREYVEGTYVQDKQNYQGQIKLAESDLVRAEDRLEWATRMAEKGYVSISTKKSEELNYQKAKFALEQAQSQFDVLEKYTKEKTIKELESEVKKAHSDELAKQATWELEKSKEDKLEKQIANCTLIAPIDGLVVYANDPSRMWGSNQSQIEEGAQVRERQKVISIPDIGRMQVNAKVHEAQVDKIKPGLRSQILVDAFAEQKLEGRISEVAPLPDASSFFSSDVKVYTTKIAITNPTEGLRPGMTAEVKILVDQLENVLSVPVQAVLQYGGKYHITKKQGDNYQRVDVELGPSNDRMVQVTKGLSDGDVIVLNPISLMTQEEQRELFKNTGATQGIGKVETAPGKEGPPGAEGKGGAPGKGGPAAKKKGGRRGNPYMQKMAPADQEKFRSASDEEKKAMLKKAGMPEDQIDPMIERMKSFGAGRGPGGPGGPGGGFGGGRRGGPPGGGDQ